MSYTVLARKYRPKKLSELFGQENLVQTLKNAIEINRVHHAFIFTGTRGVGKTTTARILALSLNCTGKDGSGKETVDPCLECDSCKDILSFRHPDVIEIDAASNTGVDSARDIIESSKYPPMVGRYKIYIIDEVHMLSKSAFNALLKTLEEPHSFIKFIFATTEFNKIPITISSRCQKFFLQNLTQDELFANLQSITSRENISCGEEVLRQIAKMARGSARDSLSILDQAISLSQDGKIDIKIIEDMTKCGNLSFGEEILSHIFDANLQEALNTSENAIQSGIGISGILSDMIEIIAKMMHSICTKTDEKEVAKLLEKLKSSDNFSVQILDRMYQVILNSSHFAQNINEKSVLDTLIIRLSYIQKIPSIDDLVSSLIKEN
ncbi:DNA polymerase III subunit gamma/tau [Candidatus Deianiraea vastatrix]|uniref:DNA polymerase III subunit gamma/tau n=1 Tax=Candidatus Deianiraea vastatrix TaxID=2163644 RepID=A0A5B8XG40_9RICK|nr:DNA polymerase III subunit gamma/tau [Candidatus Deianiraea vastatrix]QED23835.1 DNA polymerase III subunit tau [Candidatus Deianiraea vastatrix]